MSNSMGYVFSVNCPAKHFTFTIRVSEVTMTWVSSHTIYERDDIDVNFKVVPGTSLR